MMFADSCIKAINGIRSEVLNNRFFADLLALQYMTYEYIKCNLHKIVWQ